MRALILICLLSAPLHSAPALIAHGGASGANAASDARVTLNCSGANFAVATVGYYVGMGGTYTLSSTSVDSSLWVALPPQSASDIGSAVYYVSHVFGSSEVFAATVTAGSPDPTLAVACFSGVGTPVATSNGYSQVGAGGLVFTFGPVAVAAGSLVISAARYAYNSSPATVGDGFMLTDTITSFYGYTESMYYSIAPSYLSNNPAWTFIGTGVEIDGTNVAFSAASTAKVRRRIVL